MPSPAIGLPATLKPLSDPNIVLFPTPAKQTASILLPLSSLLMTFPLLVQEIPALSTFSSGAVVEPSFPSTTQFISFIPELDPAVESRA